MDFRINFTESIDFCRCSQCLYCSGSQRPRGSNYTIFDRCPRRQQDIVLVHAHHVRTLFPQYADDLKSHIPDADLLADGSLHLRTTASRLSGLIRHTLLALRTSCSVNASPRSRSIQSRTCRNEECRAVDVCRHPVAISVYQLCACTDDRRDIADCGTLFDYRIRILGVSVIKLPIP